MRTISQPWLFVLVLACLGGCATVGDGPTYAEARATTQTANKATVYVYRKHAEPTVWPVTVYFGSLEVATLNQGSFTWINLTPGKYQVRGVWSGFSGQQDASIEIEVRPATTYYLEVTGISRGVPGLGGALGALYPLRMGSGINEVSPQAAEATLATCCTFRKPTAAGY